MKFFDMRTIRTTALAALALGVATAADAAPENRCGWFQNPTPGNLWLDDSQGTWVLSTQGSDQEALGMENIPDVSEHDFVRTNGNYGYACACIKVETDAAEGRILAVYSFKQLPIKKCAADRKLPSPEQ